MVDALGQKTTRPRQIGRLAVELAIAVEQRRQYVDIEMGGLPDAEGHDEVPAGVGTCKASHTFPVASKAARQRDAFRTRPPTPDDKDARPRSWWRGTTIRPAPAAPTGAAGSSGTATSASRRAPTHRVHDP